MSVRLNAPGFQQFRRTPQQVEFPAQLLDLLPQPRVLLRKRLRSGRSGSRGPSQGRRLLLSTRHLLADHRSQGDLVREQKIELRRTICFRSRTTQTTGTIKTAATKVMSRRVRIEN